MNARKTLFRKTGKAIAGFGMIRAWDRIAVGVSGGKDSLALLDVLRLLAQLFQANAKATLLVLPTPSQASRNDLRHVS